MSCLVFCPYVFSALFALRLPRLGKKELAVCLSCICLFCVCCFVSLSYSFWHQGLAATCDCGTPWTFLILFLHQTSEPATCDDAWSAFRSARYSRMFCFGPLLLLALVNRYWNQGKNVRYHFALLNASPVLFLKREIKYGLVKIMRAPTARRTVRCIIYPCGIVAQALAN